MSVELDEFGLHIKSLVGSELREIGQARCRWQIKQDRGGPSPLVTIWGVSGPVQFQIDYEDVVALRDHQIKSSVHDHVRRIFNPV